MNLLAKSCLIAGIIPMITNLVRSSGSCEETQFTWLNEYLDGTGNEIYRTQLNEQFKNNTFCQISKKIYEEYHAIAFALEIDINGKTTISLNPGNFFIEKSREEREDVKFYIYLICSDKEIADQIEEANQLNDNEIDIDFNLILDDIRNEVKLIKNILDDYDNNENKKIRLNSVFLFKKLYDIEYETFEPNSKSSIVLNS